VGDSETGRIGDAKMTKDELHFAYISWQSNRGGNFNDEIIATIVDYLLDEEKSDAETE